MPKKSHIRVIALLGLLPACAVAQSAVPVIDVIASDTGMTVTGIVAGLSPSTIDAEMTISREDGSGSLSTRQSRKIDVGPDSRDIVATTELSTAPDLQMHVVLTLRENDAVIATSQTNIGSGN